MNIKTWTHIDTQPKKAFGHNKLTYANPLSCCILRITLKKNNFFANLSNLKGKTIIKFSAGLIQKNKNKKQLRSIVKWILEKISFFIKGNFDCVKVIIKGHNNICFTLFKELRRKKLKIVSFSSIIPIVHNGCRPPKKRRI